MMLLQMMPGRRVIIIAIWAVGLARRLRGHRADQFQHRHVGLLAALAQCGATASWSINSMRASSLA